MMRLTYKYRLNPTQRQRTALEATLEACRWVYNQTLAVRKETWETRQVSVSKFDTINMLPAWKAAHPFLKTPHSQLLQETCVRVDLAFQHFFRRLKAGEDEPVPRGNPPRFRGKGRYDSFTFPQRDNGWKLRGERLHLRAVGDVKIKLHRPIEGTIKTLTICRDALGNWYACFAVELIPIPLPPSPLRVGIDVGLNKFATLSTGEMIPNPRFFRRDEAALATAQSRRDQLPKGSPQRQKATRRVQHIHARIGNRRKDFAHKLSRYLVDTFQMIVFEDLNIKGMMQNHHLAKSMHPEGTRCGMEPTVTIHHL